MACKRMIFNNISGIITMLKMYNFTSDKIVLTYSLQFLFQVISFHLEVELKKSKSLSFAMLKNTKKVYGYFTRQGQWIHFWKVTTQGLFGPNFISSHRMCLKKIYKDFKFFKQCEVMAAILDVKQVHRTTFLKRTNQEVSHISLIQFGPMVFEKKIKM
jgi:hypothetical protein